MKIEWTDKASGDLAWLYSFLAPVAPDAAARVVQEVARAPNRLLEHPWIGERLDAYSPREVRRIVIGHYEMRYEIAGNTIFILRLWQSREHRDFDGGG